MKKLKFETGKKYKVKQSIDRLRDNFLSGEILVFEKMSYSRYDNCSGYFFKTESGENKVFDIHDNESKDLIMDYIVPE